MFQSYLKNNFSKGVLILQKCKRLVLLLLMAYSLREQKKNCCCYCSSLKALELTLLLFDIYFQYNLFYTHIFVKITSFWDKNYLRIALKGDFSFKDFLCKCENIHCNLHSDTVWYWNDRFRESCLIVIKSHLNVSP